MADSYVQFMTEYQPTQLETILAMFASQSAMTDYLYSLDSEINQFHGYYHICNE